MKGNSVIASRQKPRGRYSFTRKINRAGYLFILPFFFFFFTIKIFPVVYTFWLSFFSWDGFKAKVLVGAANYIRLFSVDPYFRKAVGNTFLILIGYLPVTIFLGLLLAILLSGRFIRRRNVWQATQFLPYTIAPVAIGFLFLILFDWSNGIVNQLLIRLGFLTEGLNWLGRPDTGRLVLIMLMIWKQWGYIMTIYLAGIASLPSEVFEAAIVDGANPFQRFYHIMLPMLKPITIFVVITNIIDGLQLFDAPKILFSTSSGIHTVGGPERSCLTVVWYLYDTAFGGSSGVSNFGYGASIAYGLFLIIVVFSLLNFKVLQFGSGTK